MKKNTISINFETDDDILYLCQDDEQSLVDFITLVSKIGLEEENKEN